MKRLPTLLPLILSLFAARVTCADPLKIQSGLISGVSSGEANDVRVYKGIPFAAPPVGELRWRPPQPAKAWEGVKQCTEFGPWCPQPKSAVGFHGDAHQSEDCLYLNVWTAAQNDGKPRPVMVWIHGGGWTTGSGASPAYSGETLVRLGAVLVTINYRLGPLGYFAHPLLSKESPRGVSGNYGTLDQIAALQWVQRNIAAFGGDPQCVTIFGESAGAGSVCQLMASPLARGLFQRAIAESGTAFGTARHLHEARGGQESMEKVGLRIAEKLGCQRSADPLAALRGKTPEEILAAADPSQGLFGKGDRFWPVIDGWVLPDFPEQLFAAGKQAPVPLLIGTNANEATLFMKQVSLARAAQYEGAVRALFAGHGDELLALFPCHDDSEARGQFARLTTVSAFVAPARRIARDVSRSGQAAFLYHFTRVAPVWRARKMGATHVAEIPYVFGTLTVGRLYDDADQRLSKTISVYWVQFARAGDPNAEGLPKWPAYDAAGDQYLELGDEVRAGHALYAKACDVMEQVTAERAKRLARPNAPGK